ncbi:hypothetical protein GCM10009627_20250 [Curtobacterium herbarum]|uniref:Secreted protein n=1 Tax=Curtobacterium herbarum TaxID=150122 RepID=A0ABP4K8K2_9MICO
MRWSSESIVLILRVVVASRHRPTQETCVASRAPDGSPVRGTLQASVLVSVLFRPALVWLTLDQASTWSASRE